MKLGFSYLLQELINADTIDYQDCKNFQILCPNCKEPVFKVVRHNKDKVIEYLSHYEKDEAYEAECELRVGNITKTFIDSTNSESKKQRLKYFLKVFQIKILENTQYDPAFIDKLGKKEYFKFMQYVHYQKALQNIKANREDLSEAFNTYIEEYKGTAGEFYKTSFALQKQKEIAMDVIDYILSGNGKPNYYFLFKVSYAILIHRLYLASQTRQQHEFEKVMAESMVSMAECDMGEGKKIADMLFDYKINPPFAHTAGYNLYSKILAEVAHEMQGCLLKLPYYEMLKEALVEKNKKIVISSNVRVS